MDLEENNILFFTRAMGLGGTENVILQLCEILKPHVKNIIVCSCGGINVKQLEKDGIKHYEIPDIDKKNIFLIIRVFKDVLRIIKKEKITIVHTHHRMATFYMFCLKKLCKVKVISTLHGTFSDKKMLTKFIYKNIDIIACGTMVKQSFVENYGIPAEQIKVINNSIKKDNNKIKQVDFLFELPDGYKKVAYIGRLSPEKGIYTLIDAISLVVKANPNIVFVIVGTGELECNLKKIVKEKGLEKFVVFLGYRNDVQNIIKQVDITVLPSYTEGLPLTPIESFAQGKPIVATIAGGTVEIVENNINGFLVPIGDSETLADAILMMFNNQDKYDEMSKMALESFEKKFSYSRFENEILDFYKSICKDGVCK